MGEIKSIEEFEKLLAEHEKFLFLKNSLTCPISHAAYEEFLTFVKEHEDVPCYYLHVQESRPLSNYIAETFAVKHESPQALLFRGKDIIWNASHREVTYDNLRKVWID